MMRRSWMIFAAPILMSLLMSSAVPAQEAQAPPPSAPDQPAAPPDKPAPAPDKPAAPAPAPPAPAPAPAKPAPAAQPAPPMVEKIEVICDGKVKNDGTVTLVFTPTVGAAAEIRVTLQKGMDKKEVCRDLAKEVSVALGKTYEVKEDGGKVRIQGTKKDMKFSLSLGGQTATGVTVELKLK